MLVTVVLVSAVLHSSWNTLLHRNADRLWTITVMTMSMAAISIVLMIARPIPLPASWPFVIGSACLEVGYILFLVRAYSLGQLGETYAIARGSAPLIVTISAALFAGEIISIASAFGVLFVSGGIFALGSWRSSLQPQGLVTAMITGGFIAAYTLVDGFGVRLAGDHISYTAWRYFLSSLPMPFILIAVRGWNGLSAPRNDVIRAAAGGVIAMTSYGAIIWALQFGPMGPIAALRECSILFTVLIARLLLKEEFNTYRLIACVVISIGAIVLGWNITE